MLTFAATVALLAFSPPAEAGELLRVNTLGDAMYLAEGSIIHNDDKTLATIIKPLGEYGLMVTRVEVDCSTRRYRPTIVSFYNQDGSLRRSADMSAGLSAQAGWATRNAEGIAESVCH